MTRTMDEGLLVVKSESKLDISCSQWKYFLVIIKINVTTSKVNLMSLESN